MKRRAVRWAITLDIDDNTYLENFSGTIVVKGFWTPNSDATPPILQMASQMGQLLRYVRDSVAHGGKASNAADVVFAGALGADMLSGQPTPSGGVDNDTDT
jgi:hypothetical protein